MQEITALDRAFASLFPPAAAPAAHRLMAAARQGQLCLPAAEAVVPAEWIADGTLDGPWPEKPLVRDGHRIYLQRNWVLETSFLRSLLRLQASVPKDLFDPTRFVASPQLLPAQAAVLQHALAHCLTVVSGGPGTGKTFTASQLLHSFAEALRPDAPPLRVKIAAPTGKAADRLAQGIAPTARCQIEAMTLHRLLRLQPGRLRLFEEAPLSADLVLVDEASMIDASLFAHLFAALAPGTRLILLGDPDQLPPVDGGSFFADLPALALNHCHRIQDAALHSLYEAARTGALAPLAALLEPLPRDLTAWIEPLSFAARPAPEALLTLFDRTRLICPLRQGPLGVDAINAALFKHQQERLTPGRWWAAPLLITRNDAPLKIYNGTPGVLLGQHRGERETVWLADGRNLALSQLPGYEIAYALSAHKSQGSEFEEVICLLPPGSEEFGREALYTALTRAKKKVRIQGDLETLKKMAAATARQHNGIKDRLERIVQGDRRL